ncbi:DMT family transporter [Rivibacter subsaxonicus]|uniref:Threonine/homoserine efflux transporter RhtA n=1 Tax=Rivibacter subsaxonicus TaxID=457575 RepID=A0A4Q7W1A5_9BURK|nr:DMT family transporter [Rivibacter subsaxonicus]RZU03044.1 threonine/homoserine efflux transporter RhtA [Rivibacter subsaxonicus]
MKQRDLFELLLLAALWGASFLFMRLGAADFGPLALAALRVAIAAAVLLPLLLWRGEWAAMHRHWKPIALVGIVNSALPFLAYAYAALSINAGLASIFNATSPLWAALIAWAWLGDRLTPPRVLGLAIGFVGVIWLAWDKASFKPGAEAVGFAVLACLGATLMYGLGASMSKKWLAGVPPMATATGSQLAAAVLLLPLGLGAWPAQPAPPLAWGAVIALGVLSTGLAYLLYFRLIAHVGPANAIAVTFLIPLFAVLWGGLFLGERLTLTMLGGGALILLGTSLATGFWRPGARQSPR